MDGLFGVGPLELIIVIALALIVLGPERLPGVIRDVVKFIKQMRAIGQELTSQFTEELNMLDDLNPNKLLKDVIDIDEEIDAKELLGINEKDLKLDDVNLDIKKKKATTNTSTKVKTSTSTANAPSTAPHKRKSSTNRTKPALGETDPEDTGVSDAVIAKDELANEEAAKEEASNSIDADSSEVMSSAETISSDAVDIVDSTISEPVAENRIAPPSMSNAQSLVAGQSTTAKPANKPTTNKITSNKTNGSQVKTPAEDTAIIDSIPDTVATVTETDTASDTVTITDTVVDAVPDSVSSEGTDEA